MKKILVLFLIFAALTIAVVGLNGCDIATVDGEFSIVATIFPEYDWVTEILGERVNDVDVTLLINNGVDLHSYEPTVADIVKISTCDMFIYVGGESDGWVKGALKNSTNGNMTVINLLEVLGDTVKEEEVVEGMEGESEEGGDEVEYDEHVWLSLKNAAIFTKVISEKLCAIDAANAATYAENAAKYVEKLNALDAEYKAAVDAAPYDTVLFGDRFPFRYLIDDYGIKYYAAFVGCSAETEASPQTITFLAGKLDELDLPCILTIDGSSHDIANTIKQASADKNQTVLTLDSMQSVTALNVQNGADYCEMMQANLSVLKTALGVSEA